jgi:hypothetical protein
MPEAYSPEQRAIICDRVIVGLSKGTPLTVLCREEGMPCDDTVRNWADEDAALARDIARAREAGFDAIAMDGLKIADDVTEDPASRRVRTDYRLKLLAKWDPKRYGDKQLIGSDPDNPLPAAVMVTFRKPDAASAD